MDSAKFKKLQDYAVLLEKQAESEEKEKDYSGAIQHYLKAVDVLLVMADAAPNYPDWLNCASRAESHQKRVRKLIALASVQQDQNNANVSSATPNPPKTVVKA